ncbi:MAG TPA: RidA family protein [Thermomicrobiales bacterium]|nr:RidA family protein [Thermomicrobiales bacterium]HRA47269.1 RidA family protein [Thermomicrobiales bacterium]
MSVSAGLSIVSTTDSPAAIGPYSQGIVVGNLLFTAGQIPLDPVTMDVAGEDIRAQSERVMANLDGVLRAAGSSLGHVVKTTCFLSDLNDFGTFNEVYGHWFGDHKPARSTVQVAKLPKAVLVEVECVALIP